MIRTLPGATVDSESLQADVMRFMAIIGFCLVAVFALVRQNGTEPPAPARTTALQPAPVPAPRPIKQPTRPMPKATVRAVPKDPPPPSTTEEPRLQAEVTPDVTTPSDSNEPVLTLSFTSDRDFLRLLGAGTIELFVIAPGASRQTLKLDSQQRFVSSTAPGRVYELMPETIPAPIVAALVQQQPTAAPMTWGVRLPAQLEQAIARQRDQHREGTLLIDRHARVRHVPPAA